MNLSRSARRALSCLSSSRSSGGARPSASSWEAIQGRELARSRSRRSLEVTICLSSLATDWREMLLKLSGKRREIGGDWCSALLVAISLPWDLTTVW